MFTYKVPSQCIKFLRIIQFLAEETVLIPWLVRYEARQNDQLAAEAITLPNQYRSVHGRCWRCSIALIV